MKHSTQAVSVSLVVLVLASLARTSTAQQTVISFEALSDDEVITNQYPSATFSARAGRANFAQDESGSVILCTGYLPGGVNCREDTFVDFTFPVNGLSLVGVEANYPGVAAKINVFESGGYSATVDVIGLGGPGDVLVDLSSFMDVTRIEIVDIVDSQTLENGIGWDDFMFTQGPPNRFCLGDSSGSVCPCVNTGGTYEGCANSSGAGAVVDAVGTTSVASDNLALQAANLIPNQSALCFVGNVAINGGQGLLFGDGLRCVGQNIVRLGVSLPDASGAAIWGPGLASAGNWLAGDVRFFQVWYRDPTASPCNAGFNLTNGVEVHFTP